MVGWLPYRLDLVDGAPRVRWVRCPTELDDGPPKFAPAVEALRATEDRPESVTDIEALAATRQSAATLVPDGFLFHMARCGSTLVSNVLSALPDSLVIKEAQPIDSCLRTDHDLAPETRARWLTDLVACLGQRFGGHERRYFIKFTSWNVLHHQIIRQCFPQTPCVFLYRDPLEVLVSMLRAEPAWAFEVVPGLSRAGRSTAEYYARVLGAFLETGVELAAAGASIVSYAQLGEDLLESVVAGFGVELDETVVRIIEEQRRVYSKDPSRPFVPDGEAKRREASAEAREAAERWGMGPFGELEAIRTARVGETVSAGPGPPPQQTGQ